MSRHITFAGMLATALALAPTLQAATPSQTAPFQAATASGTVTINGATYNMNGPAECLYTPHGSIYETAAAMWSVMMDGRGGSGVSRLNATMWLPTSGGAPQILFQAHTAAGVVEVATVVGGKVKGSATARAEQKGGGGTLFIAGRTAAGHVVSMAISCSGFMPPEDNG